MQDIIERLAIILHTYKGGIDPKEYERIYGLKFPQWEKVPKHERDDCRFQARKVVEYLTTGKIK